MTLLTTFLLTSMGCAPFVVASTLEGNGGAEEPFVVDASEDNGGARDPFIVDASEDNGGAQDPFVVDVLEGNGGTEEPFVANTLEGNGGAQDPFIVDASEDNGGAQDPFVADAFEDNGEAQDPFLEAFPSDIQLAPPDNACLCDVDSVCLHEPLHDKYYCVPNSYILPTSTSTDMPRYNSNYSLPPKYQTDTGDDGIGFALIVPPLMTMVVICVISLVRKCPSKTKVDNDVRHDVENPSLNAVHAGSDITLVVKAVPC